MVTHGISRWWVAPLLALALACATPRSALAHPGVGILVGQDGTVYFVLYGPHPVMMIRPGGTPEFATPDAQPRFIHHLAWAPDGRLLAATDGGVLWAITPGVGAEPYLPEPSGAEDDDPPFVGEFGDPFAVDADGSILTVRDHDPLFGDLRGRVIRIGLAGTITPFVGGARPGKDGGGEDAGFGTLHYGAMAWDAGGTLYLTERERVRTVTPDGVVASLGPALEIGAGLAVEADGSLLVVEARPGRVLRIDPSGRAETVTEDDRFVRLVGVAAGPDGSIYLKDHPRLATRIWRLEPAGDLTMLAEVDHLEVEEAIGYEPPPPTPAQDRERMRSYLILSAGIPVALMLFWLGRRRFTLSSRP